MTQDVPATSTAPAAPALAPTPVPRALFVTDSDSYVKWGAALAGQVPGEHAQLKRLRRVDVAAAAV